MRSSARVDRRIQARGHSLDPLDQHRASFHECNRARRDILVTALQREVVGALVPENRPWKSELPVCGAARTVTGSCYLFNTRAGRLLVDCGLFQGPKTLKALRLWRFPVSSG